MINKRKKREILRVKVCYHQGSPNRKREEGNQKICSKKSVLMFSNDEEAEISQRDSKESVEEGSSSHSKSKEEGKTTQEAASKQQNGSSSDVESLQQNELIEKQSHFFFGQIFTDEDVITLLQGQIDFKSEHGDESKTEFHLFVKDKLHMEFTKLQVTEKLRRLKQKFLGNFNRKKQAPLEFSNAYEYTVFKLSEKLWGNEGQSL